MYIFQVKNVCKELELNEKVLREISTRLNESINDGLSRTKNPKAKVKCFPTYVRDLPNGKGRLFISTLFGFTKLGLYFELKIVFSISCYLTYIIINLVFFLTSYIFL